MSKTKYRAPCDGCNRTKMCISPPHKPRHLNTSSTAPIDPIPCPCTICIIKVMCTELCVTRAKYTRMWNYYYDLSSNVEYVYPRSDDE